MTVFYVRKLPSIIGAPLTMHMHGKFVLPNWELSIQMLYLVRNSWWLEFCKSKNQMTTYFHSNCVLSLFIASKLYYTALKGSEFHEFWDFSEIHSIEDFIYYAFHQWIHGTLQSFHFYNFMKFTALKIRCLMVTNEDVYV